MRDRYGFNPLGSFLGACAALLVGALLATIAVRLLIAIWPWLLGVGLTGLLITGLVRLYRARRGQRW